jgi:hypothetical protein
MAYIMEGISLFGATPRLSAIPAGGFVISTSCITGEAPLVAGSPIADEVPMPKEVHAQGFIGSESVVDLGVIPGTSSKVGSAVDLGTQAEGTGASAADILVGSEHLDNIDEFEFLAPSHPFSDCTLYPFRLNHTTLNALLNRLCCCEMS